MKKEIIINTDKEMVELGYKIGKNAFPNMVITMEGDLGAGKTTMTKGIGKALDIQRVINSPTFTIMKVYTGTLPLYHMDVYRIDNNSGDEYLEEYFEMDGVTVIEWAENISELIQFNHLQIKININSDTSRTVSIEIKEINERYLEEYNRVIEGIDK